MEFIEITLGLLLAVAAVAAIGKWLPVPLPILLVAGGVLLSYLPPFDSLQPASLTIGELGNGAAAIALLQQAGLA